MRERLSAADSFGFFDRITPARAGKTVAKFVTTSLLRDHPRSCGKDKYFAELAQKPVGSPPLVRERPCVQMTPTRWDRITPARAGKTNEWV